MLRTNIFTVGGTVQAGDGLYIPRAADEELLTHCLAGEFAYVLSPRQVGKSSLMVRTADQLAEKGIRSAMIDLNRVGRHIQPETWYLGFLKEIADKLKLKTNVFSWRETQADMGSNQLMLLFLQEIVLTAVEEHLVIFVDEIDTTLRLPFADDFFAAIRSLYLSRANEQEFNRLSFVLIGVATPTDLMRDPMRTPFNIGNRVELDDFTFNEALPLSEGFGCSTAEAHQLLRWALQWTGGHPFLTQRLCLAIADEGRSAWSEADVDSLVSRTFFGDQSYKDTNLMNVHNTLTREDKETPGILSTYRDIYRGRKVENDEQSVIKSHLKLSGIVRRDGGLLRLRNPIYKKVFGERWIKEHLSVDWPKRLTKIAAATLMTLLVLWVPLGIYAFVQRAEAIRQAADAVRHHDEATAATARLESAYEELNKSLTEEEIERRRADEAAALANIKTTAATTAARRLEIALVAVEDERNRAERLASQVSELQEETKTLQRAAESITHRNDEELANKGIEIAKLNESLKLLSLDVTDLKKKLEDCNKSKGVIGKFQN